MSGNHCPSKQWCALSVTRAEVNPVVISGAMNCCNAKNSVLHERQLPHAGFHAFSVLGDAATWNVHKLLSLIKIWVEKPPNALCDDINHDKDTSGSSSSSQRTQSKPRADDPRTADVLTSPPEIVGDTP